MLKQKALVRASTLLLAVMAIVAPGAWAAPGQSGVDPHKQSLCDGIAELSTATVQWRLSGRSLEAFKAKLASYPTKDELLIPTATRMAEEIYKMPRAELEGKNALADIHLITRDRCMASLKG